MSRGKLRVPLAPLVPGVALLPADAASYLLKVHRKRAGDMFVAFDPERALEADAELLESVRGSSPSACIGDVRPAAMTPRRRVTLIQAAAKGDKMDAIVRDATELGATRIVPALAARSVALLSGGDARADRFRRIAVQAARQCGRGDTPRVESPLPFAEALERYAKGEGRWGLCLDPGADISLGERLTVLPPDAEVVLVVGPEGGLTGEELDLCERAGLVRVSLGPLVLRTETVCAAALGALLVLGYAAEPHREAGI